MNNEIWVLAECAGDAVRKDSLEAVGLGKTFKMATVALLIGAGTAPAREAVIAQGVGELRVIDAPELAAFDAARFAGLVGEAASAGVPAMTLAAQSPNGIALGPRLAALWDCAFVPNIVSVSPAEPSGCRAVQAAYGGKVHVARQLAAGKPVVLGTLPGSIGVGPDVKRPAGGTTLLEATEMPPACTRVVGFKKADPREVGLDEADAIVAGGRGYGSEEGLSTLWRLADALGAAPAGSKPLFDNGWIPRTRFVGQSSGRKLAPGLFVAAGVSGSNYFLGGMKDARTIVAINKDKGAPLMKAADLAVVGDVADVVPALAEALERRRNKEVG